MKSEPSATSRALRAERALASRGASAQRRASVQARASRPRSAGPPRSAEPSAQTEPSGDEASAGAVAAAPDAGDVGQRIEAGAAGVDSGVAAVKGEAAATTKRRRGRRGGRRHKRRPEGEGPAGAPLDADADPGHHVGARPRGGLRHDRHEPPALPPPRRVPRRPPRPTTRGPPAKRLPHPPNGAAGVAARRPATTPAPGTRPPAAAAAGDESGERGKPRRGSRRGRRALAPVGNAEADLPGYKEILIASDAAELRVALVEDGRLAEIYIERPGRRSFAGNIYLGKVDNVLPGIDASFVDVGIDRNGFLAVDDVAVPEGAKRSRRIGEVLKPGQEVLVQVSKDPMGSKGARLTGQISIAGRYLVYVPGGSGVGVSRRLSTEERERLREACKSLKVKDAGLIVRTVAEGKDIEELRRDLKFLSRLWSRVKSKADKVKAPAIVHEEDDVALQVARDLFNDTFSAVLVDDAKRRDKLVSYLDKTAPELADRVKLYDDEEPLFRAHGIEEQIARALERRVPLPSGGNLVIDHTEAMTVIDVNSGKFTSGKGLEDTITRTNLEAAREVVRQLRLRDIGGIIIIDFIDMEHPKNRDAVLGKLQAELDTDRTKTYVVEISPLGLVEMTRQNITDGARGILTQACPACEGRARVLSNETMALTVERRLRRHVGETTAAAMLVEVSAGVAERLAAGGRSKRIEKETGRRFFFEGSRSLPVDTYRIIAEGSLAAVKAHRVPLKEDDQVTVELDYGLTYSPGDAVAHLDGFRVVVLNGRRFLGEKRKVRVTSVTRSGAVAVLV